MVKGKIIFLTGATDGIGRQAAIDLARMGAIMLLHGRDQEKAKAVLNEISDAAGNENSRSFIAELASQSQIRLMTEEVREKCDHSDILINNAGVF